MILLLCRDRVSIFSIFMLLLPVVLSYGGERQPSEPVPLKVVTMPYLGYAPFFIADAEGYFAEQGLDVQFIRMNRTATLIPALIQGDIDVLSGTIWPSHFNAIARGARIRFVANRSYVDTSGCIYSAVVARRDLIEHGDLQNPAQLRNLRISVPPSSHMGYFIEKLLSRANMTLHDVEIVDHLPAVELEAFRKNTIDLAFMTEPWLTRIVNTGHGVIWLPDRKVVPGFQWGFILYGPSLLDKNPDAGRRFLVAYFKAVRQYNRGKTERNVDILSQYTELDRDLLEKACWPSLREDGYINFEHLIDFQDWAVRKGLLDRKLAEDEFWDHAFVDYATKMLHIQKQ
ncbi:MAG: ABC transporter substrate-binding protein [Gemmatimonadota bacterium]|nr:MAG: ABC transporter substrate-binding protein [Gemmatimonadota bacterium]